MRKFISVYVNIVRDGEARMFLSNLTGPFEAVLFASGEPVTDKQLMELLQIDALNVEELAGGLSRELDARKSGLQLRRVAGGWQLVTRPEYFSYVEKLTQVMNKKLSPAAMETLAIIAFKQPITKQEIEHIRGVHIERVLARLLELELICEVGRKAVIGRPILYGTTKDFLKCVGLNDITDLPELPGGSEMTEEIEAEQLALIEGKQTED